MSLDRHTLEVVANWIDRVSVRVIRQADELLENDPLGSGHEAQSIGLGIRVLRNKIIDHLSRPEKVESIQDSPPEFLAVLNKMSPGDQKVEYCEWKKISGYAVQTCEGVICDYGGLWDRVKAGKRCYWCGKPIKEV